jgi:hypothetical protein
MKETVMLIHGEYKYTRISTVLCKIKTCTFIKMKEKYIERSLMHQVQEWKLQKRRFLEPLQDTDYRYKLQWIY